MPLLCVTARNGDWHANSCRASEIFEVWNYSETTIQKQREVLCLARPQSIVEPQITTISKTKGSHKPKPTKNKGFAAFWRESTEDCFAQIDKQFQRPIHLEKSVEIFKVAIFCNANGTLDLSPPFHPSFVSNEHPTMRITQIHQFHESWWN